MRSLGGPWRRERRRKTNEREEQQYWKHEIEERALPIDVHGASQLWPTVETSRESEPGRSDDRPEQHATERKTLGARGGSACVFRRLTFELTGRRKLAKPAVAFPVQRRVRRHWPVIGVQAPPNQMQRPRA